MRYLLDTGVLLRLVNRDAPLHEEVRKSVRLLKSRGDVATTTYQNLAEFWNVSTRPGEARGGFGLTIEQTRLRLRVVERIVTLLPESVEAYPRWKELVVAYGVRGVQVHDAKLVALMTLHGLTHILTLNPRDFARYSAVSAATPKDLLASASKP